MLKPVSILLSILILLVPCIQIAHAVEPVVETDLSEDVSEQEPQDEKTYMMGIEEGELSAILNYESINWFYAGVGGGMIGTLLGMTLIVAGSQNESVYPPETEMAMVKTYGDQYQFGYLQGYNDKAGTKKLWSSVSGGALGTTITIVILYSMMFSN